MTSLDLSVPVEDLTRQLIDIPSVSGGETAIADAVEAALSACEHLSVVRDGDAVVARTTVGHPERVIIAGHLDTVPIKHNVPSRLTASELGIIGRGATDMKAGVAVMLSLAAELIEPTRDITWVFYDHEEVEDAKNGLGRLARRHPELLDGDFAVLCEPTSAQIEGGCNGTLRMNIALHGKASHSARSWKGTNAIHAAAPVLAALAAYQARTVEVDGLQYREGLNAVGVNGGIAGNVIPDICTITVNYRFAPGQATDDAVQHVSDVIAASGAGDFTATVTDRADACRPGLDAPLAASFVDAVASTGAPEPRAKLGWTDVARFGALGIPAVNYGPGDPELAHTDDEWCPIEEIHQCRAGLAAWLTT